MSQLHHLIIFGAQGSGKGTQAEILSRNHGLVYLGLGDLFREIAAEDSDLGRQIKNIIEAGQLVPDEITNQLVAQKLGNIPPTVGFIIDGYPRNLEQAEALHQTLERLERMTPTPVFLNLEVPTKHLLTRLAKRREIEGRADDTEETIAERLRIYHEQTRPILENVGHWADLIHIDGDQPIPEVTAEIEQKL